MARIGGTDFVGSYYRAKGLARQDRQADEDRARAFEQSQQKLGLEERRLELAERAQGAAELAADATRDAASRKLAYDYTKLAADTLERERKWADSDRDYELAVQQHNLKVAGEAREAEAQDIKNRHVEAETARLRREGAELTSGVAARIGGLEARPLTVPHGASQRTQQMYDTLLKLRESAQEAYTAGNVQAAADLLAEYDKNIDGYEKSRLSDGRALEFKTLEARIVNAYGTALTQEVPVEVQQLLDQAQGLSESGLRAVAEDGTDLSEDLMTKLRGAASTAERMAETSVARGEMLVETNMLRQDTMPILQGAQVTQFQSGDPVQVPFTSTDEFKDWNNEYLALREAISAGTVDPTQLRLRLDKWRGMGMALQIPEAREKFVRTADENRARFAKVAENTERLMYAQAVEAYMLATGGDNGLVVPYADQGGVGALDAGAGVYSPEAYQFPFSADPETAVRAEEQFQQWKGLIQTRESRFYRKPQAAIQWMREQPALYEAAVDGVDDHYAGTYQGDQVAGATIVDALQAKQNTQGGSWTELVTPNERGNAAVTKDDIGAHAVESLQYLNPEMADDDTPQTLEYGMAVGDEGWANPQTLPLESAVGPKFKVWLNKDGDTMEFANGQMDYASQVAEALVDAGYLSVVPADPRQRLMADRGMDAETTLGQDLEAAGRSWSALSGTWAPMGLAKRRNDFLYDRENPLFGSLLGTGLSHIGFGDPKRKKYAGDREKVTWNGAQFEVRLVYTPKAGALMGNMGGASFEQMLKKPEIQAVLDDVIRKHRK